ncbi:FAD-dependent oxidoreductase [Salinifilum ghardaiensis]
MVTTRSSPASPERLRCRPTPEAHYDVVLVGAGVHGLATAHYLASRHGIRNVAVLEDGWLDGDGARGAAVISSRRGSGESAALDEHALELWEQLPAELEDELLLEQRGVLTAAHTEQEVRDGRRRAFADWLGGADAEWLTPAEIRDVCPILHTGDDVRYPVLGATFQPRGGIAEHDRVARALARKAEELGVDLVQGCTVTGLRTSGERVTGVETSLGPISAGRVGLAAAGRTTRLTDALGLRLPLRSHPSQAVVSELLESVPPCAVVSEHVHCCCSGTHEGELVLGAGTGACSGVARPGPERPGAERPGPAHVIERQLAAAMELFPVFAKAHVLRTWSGLVDITPDSSPITGPAPHENLFVNCGWGTGVFQAAPAAGHLFAHTIATGRPHPLAAACGLERFGTGALAGEHRAAVPAR